ncbi:hypothetical protein F8M41_002682 [Gigaspora margarita]|uniref:MARVEL domain-containing protein n=1 Tax=Gigaspora margarita TaxID=4874 RepID=A0A8H4AYH5_GIGMA|nr:hypothetical protein F8M41_002682 [Gigaspora margarita]
MLVGYHINKFRLLKVFQVLVTIICGVLEVTEFITYSIYVDDVNSSGLYSVRLSKLEYIEKTNTNDGQVKIFYYIVIFLTLIGIIICLFNLRTMWNSQSWWYLLGAEFFFFTLYLAAGIASLYTESGNGLNCNITSENTNNPIVTGIVNWRIFQCHLAIASLVVCWVNIGLLLLSLLISWRRAVELSWVLTPSSSFNDDVRGNMEEFRGNMEGVIDYTNERMFVTNHEPATF